MSANPSIYVACLASYNNCLLHGEWIDAHQEPEAINMAIQEMLKDSPIINAEEYAIHDYEGFEGVEISQYTNIETVHEIAHLIYNHGKPAAELYNCLGSVKEVWYYLESKYCGFYDGVEDYARELTEDTTNIPENIQYYIDYQKMARDMEYAGELLVIGDSDGEHIFYA